MTSNYSLRNTVLGEKYSDFRQFTKVNPHLKISTRDARRTVERVVLHCTDANGWTPEYLSDFFVTARNFSICSYHYYIQAEKIWHMVGENVITPHAAPYNSTSVSLSIDYYASKFEKLNIKAEPNIYENAVKTAAYLCIKFRIAPIKNKLVGHRELPGTGFFEKNDIKYLRKTCPGLTIDLDVFRRDVCVEMQKVIGTVPDGIWGPKSHQSLIEFTINHELEN